MPCPSIQQVGFGRGWFVFLFVLLGINHLFAQNNSEERTESDSVQLNRDSIAVNQSELEFVIDYKASDSIRFDVTQQIIHLYNAANIKYGKATELSAGYISIDQTSGSVEAVGIEDENGEKFQEPVFKDRRKEYKSKKIKYNFKSQKGIISGATTQQGEGIVRSQTVKRNDNGDLYANDNQYIICGECDPEPPEIAIRSRKMKIIPGKVTASGPFYMELYGVPTPFAFPFGLFPQRGKRASGFIMPLYGETRQRGFFLSNGGLYWAISDYADLSILGEIYTIGGWGFTTRSNYKKRYFYNGFLNFQYNRRINEIEGSLEKAIQNDFRLQWNHTPESRGDSRFSASVNLASSTFNQNNARRVQDYLSASMSSNVNYNKTFTGTPFSFSGALRVQQNLITNVADISPNASLRMNKIYPLRKANSQKKNLLSELNLSYSGEARARIQNVIGEGDSRDTLELFKFENINRLLEDAQMGMKHTIPISTSTSILKYFNLSLSSSYSETWYPEQYTFRFNPTTQLIEEDTLAKFSRFYQFNGSISTSTQFYGFYYPKFLKIKAIRHQIAPRIGFSYTPDFSQGQWNMYETVQSDLEGNTQKLSRYRGIYGSPSQGESGNINFGLQNTFEMKLGAKKSDSLQKDRKVQLLNANIGGSYNLIRPDNGFQLSNLGWSANTRIKKFNFNLSGTINPYAYEITARDTLENGRLGDVTEQNRIPVFAWNAGKGIGYLESVRFSVNTSLNPKSDNTPKRKARNAQEEEILRDFYANPDLYVDFSMPWSLNLSYSLNYTKQGEMPANDIVQSLTFSGNVSVTKNWKVNFNSGYDFENKDLTFTQLSITRDLKCWRMTTTWIPFGPRAGYTFNLGVKSQMFSDLKIERRNSWYYR